MPDPFRNYDAWLEAPFQRMCAEHDQFIDWCEANDVDPDAEDASAQFIAAMESDDEDRRLQAAEDRAELQRDRELDERYEW